MYTDFYGFTIKPFQLSPDPRFFFGSSVHKRALAYLRYGLSQAEGFIVITGCIGTGKTMLVRSLFNELDSHSVVAAQLVTTQLEADDLLRMVVAAFGLPHKDLSKATLIHQFEDFLRNCAQAGKRTLLVVDEAQNLPERSLEELRMLSNFQVADTPLLQSFLLGQEEFRTHLQAAGMEQLRQRVIASCHLTPLNVSETRDYIEHRLHVAGWQDNPHFQDESFTAIHRYTEGIPRRINVFCDRLLLYGYLEEKTVLAAADVQAVSAELDRELLLVRNTPAPPVVAPASVPAAAAPAQRPTGGRVEHYGTRIDELEKSVSALIIEPSLQDARLGVLEKRIAELEKHIARQREVSR